MTRREFGAAFVQLNLDNVINKMAVGGILRADCGRKRFDTCGGLRDSSALGGEPSVEFV